VMKIASSSMDKNVLLYHLPPPQADLFSHGLRSLQLGRADCLRSCLDCMSSQGIEV
jgi:hypothetical protein